MKKLLALVLALVMVMSLCITSNAAFAGEEYDYDEAVEVMAAVGVFQGDENGKFNGKTELTREQAAKLIAYLDLGEKTAEALPEVKVFNDVEANRWSAKYIAYCADAGYLAGVGDGNFDPAGKLTGYAFGKMLLCVLGYDAAVEGFTGSNWTLAVAKLMQSKDIAKGIDGSASAALTREQAAQYCLNALKATMVEYESKGTQITINGAVIATGASKAEAVTSKSDYAEAFGDDADDDGFYTVELGEKLYDGDLKVVTDTKTDDFGRPAVAWEYDKDEVGTYGTATPVATYTAAVKGGTLYTDLGKVALTDDNVKAVKLNGKDFANGAAWLKAHVKSGDKKTIGGNGTVIEVYENSDDTYTFVAVQTFVGEITKFTPAKLDANGDVIEGDEAYITVKAYNNDNDSWISNLEFETEDFTKQDAKDGTIVLLTATTEDGTDYTVQSAVKAEKVENVKITSVNGSKFTAEKTYSKSENAYYGTAVGYKNVVDVYTDAYGYAIYVDLYEAAEKNYAYVLDIGEKADAFENTTYYAKLLMLDGTVETVEVDEDSWEEASSEVEETFASYEVDDGVYTLTQKGKKAANGTEIVKGKIGAKVANEDVNGNANTLYIIAKKNSDNKTVYNFYTGYKAVAGVKAEAEQTIKSAYFNTGDDSYVDYVFVDATANAEFADDTSKVTYAFIAESVSSSAVTDELGTYYTMNAVVDGKVEEVKLSANVKNTVVANSAKVYTATAAKFNSDGLITGLTNGTRLTATATVKAEYANETIKLGEVIYQLDKDLEVYSIDADDDYAVTASSIEEVAEDDTVYFTVETDTTVTDYQHILTVIYNFGH